MRKTGNRLIAAVCLALCMACAAGAEGALVERGEGTLWVCREGGFSFRLPEGWTERDVDAEARAAGACFASGMGEARMLVQAVGHASPQTPEARLARARADARFSGAGLYLVNDVPFLIYACAETDEVICETLSANGLRTFALRFSPASVPSAAEAADAILLSFQPLAQGE